MIKLNIIYCLLARYFFEFGLPVYGLFAFSLSTNILIWSIFLYWQVIGILCFKNLTGRSIKDVWSGVVPPALDIKPPVVNS